MDWRWRFERSDGTVIEPDVVLEEPWPSQADAETWLGEHWRLLLDAGVDQVVLMELDREVYGPMSLQPPAS